MALWLKLQDTLPDHKKAIASAKALYVDRDMLVGKLIRLWLWAVINRESGFISDDELEVVAEKMRWQGDVQQLFDALCIVPNGYDAGFLERVADGYEIHDWTGHVGALMDKQVIRREQDRNRQQRRRERLRVEIERDISETVTETSRVTDVTVTQLDQIRLDNKRLEIGDKGITPSPPTLPPVPPIKAKTNAFKVPALEEVRAYCAERGNQVDPQRFIDFYESNGWKVGRNPMRSWQAAVRTWERDSSSKKTLPNRGQSKQFDPFMIPNDPERYRPRDDDFGDEFMRRLEAKKHGKV